MANGIESFSEAKNLARVKAGFKGGPFLNNINWAQKMTFVEGYPEGVNQKLMSSAPPTMNIIDPWAMRYPNAKMK